MVAEPLNILDITHVTKRFDFQGQEIVIALKNGEGNYQASPETLRKLVDNDQVVFRYLDNPNGSANDIAGITNDRGNVVGLMPHPEHNVEALTGATLDVNGGQYMAP